MKSIFSFIKSEKGFSLIEAVVTVAIVGIVVVPIATVFSGSLKTTMKAREQFHINEIAQRYMEVMKSKTFTELEAYIDNTDTNNDGQMDAQEAEASGNQKLPLGMTVRISYDLNNSVLNTANNTIPVVTASVISADFILLFKNDDLTTEIQKSDTSLIATLISDSGSSRDVDISYYPNEHKLISQKNCSAAAIELTDASLYTIIIKCEDLILDSPHSITNINIDNKTTKTVNVYIYRDSKDVINPNVEILGNNVTIQNNLTLPRTANTRIYSIKTEVLKDGIVVASYSSTKLDE